MMTSRDIRFITTWLLIAAVLLGFGIAGAALADDAPRAALKYKRDLIRISHATWGLDAPIAVFAAQIHQESAWNPSAKSAVGAQGLAQFMPSTSEWIAGLYDDLGDNQPRNPIWAMRAMVRYDSWLNKRIRARDQCSRMAMTLSAYNGGLGWVYKDQKLASAKGADSLVWFNQVERFNAGRSTASVKENRGYPRNILIRWQPMYASWGAGVSCA